MNAKLIILSAAALLTLGVGPIFAQSSAPAPAPAAAPAPGEVAQRKDNQQDRIANGIRSGQLSAGETKNLETKEAGLNKEIALCDRRTTDT
jgi:hypothetical protein